MLNMPFSDRVAARLSYSMFERDGTNWKIFIQVMILMVEMHTASDYQ